MTGRVMRRLRVPPVLLVVGFAVLSGGCPPAPRRFAPEPIPLRDAVRIVNDNHARITGTLRAQGAVDGRFTLSDGRRGSYHLDGVLFYLAPRYVRFDLKRFGDRKFLFGSNAEDYWYYNPEEEAYECGRHGEDDQLAPLIPVRPDQMADALGLTILPTETSGDSRVRLVQRVVDDFQQVLFLIHDDAGEVTLEKEYWLDGYPPRLIRRVVFRDGDGVVTMQSQLDDYKAAGPDGPLLPHTVTADWLDPEGRLRFRVSRWTVHEDIGPESIQFRVPRECE